MFFLSKSVLLWNEKVVGVPTHVRWGKDVTKVGNCNFHKKKILGSYHDFVREKEDQKLSEKYFIITYLKKGP